VRIIQDKFAQKEFIVSKMDSSQVLITPYRNLVGSSQDALADELKNIAKEFQYPMMLKSKKLAYDGRGNYVIKNGSDIPLAITALGGGERELYVEKWVLFSKELAVMVAKGT
jgi:phosphoribosylaminoimidazole carboxylase